MNSGALAASPACTPAGRGHCAGLLPGEERTTVAIAERLAGASVPPLASVVVARETERLERELADRGAKLSDEQREAIELACGTRPFVVIEGHAGTGKSTTLTGIARAHQTAGRQIIVTSTAAITAERLARELTAAGVKASAYSTAALHAGITNGGSRSRRTRRSSTTRPRPPRPASSSACSPRSRTREQG